MPKISQLKINNLGRELTYSLCKKFENISYNDLNQFYWSNKCELIQLDFLSYVERIGFCFPISEINKNLNSNAYFLIGKRTQKHGGFWGVSFGKQKHFQYGLFGLLIDNQFDKTKPLSDYFLKYRNTIVHEYCHNVDDNRKFNFRQRWWLRQERVGEIFDISNQYEIRAYTRDVFEKIIMNLEKIYNKSCKEISYKEKINFIKNDEDLWLYTFCCLLRVFTDLYDEERLRKIFFNKIKKMWNEFLDLRIHYVECNKKII